MAVMTRITTGMIQRNYQNNLTSTLGGLEATRKQVETGRRFEHSYEDPTASAKAAILEKRYSRVQDYISNAENAMSWQMTQEEAAMAVESYAETINKNYSIAAVNGTNAAPNIRATYATAIESLQESMVSALNAKYGETFVLAGNEGKEPPFALADGPTDADGNVMYKVLTYRGMPVDDMNGTEQAVDENGNPMFQADGTTPITKADLAAELLNEHSYIDLGFGMEFIKDANGDATDEIAPASAFDMALPGVKIIGYGTNGETVTINGQDVEVSNNLVNLAGQMAAILRDENYTKEEYTKCWNQFEQGYSDLMDSVSALGTKYNLLETTLDRLETEKLDIETQFDATVNIDPAEAIMNYSWADYAYNSALKVGTSIISPSLLDFVQGR